MTASSPAPVTAAATRPAHQPSRAFGWTAAVGLTAIGATVLYLGSHRPDSAASQTLGNLAILLAGLFAAVACARRARHRDGASRGWALMSAAALLWSGGQLVYTYHGLARDNVYPFPSAADAAYLGYTVPAVAALFAFPRPPARLLSRLRALLDAVVISLGILVISETTVLHHVHEVSDLGTVGGWTTLAYPVLDMMVAAVVLSLGMRQPVGRRRMWLVLGTGLVTLAVTDSVYVRLVTEGQTAITGTPLTGGWMLAFFLIGLASLAPTQVQATAGSRDHTLGVQLIPYLPVLGALIVLGGTAVIRDPFLLAAAVALLAAVIVRQVMIVYENVSLTRDLEAKVAARTAELNTLASILTSSSDAIVGVSLDNVVLAWNPAAERLYGYRAAEVVNGSADVLTAGGLPAMRPLLAQVSDGEQVAGAEVTWSRPDGSTVPVAVSVSPILEGGAPIGISIFGQDVTERQRAAAALEQAREEALESSRLKSEFLATMSHEIRTPMNGVIGLTSLLLETELDDVQRQYADGVRSAGESLLGVINDILDFSKLEAGKVVLDPADLDPRRLVDDVGALLAPAAFSKGLELIAYCVPEVPATVRGDSGRIRQILLNLASNAVKFTSDGEVVIKVKPLPAADGLVRLRFEVRDTGIGIAEADRHRLFQSFSQADASTTRRFGGTGLGLAICRRLVEVMGGDIGVESAAGVGSTFWFELPLPVGKPPEALDSVSHDLLTDLRVLIVDDNATNRTILESQFLSWRMRPDLVDSAESALARLRDAVAQGQPYDLAVLDMCMPKVDGLELARTISADPAVQAMPMIMLTSSMLLDPSALQAAGVHQWLTKPVRSSELYDRLMRLMAPREAGLNAEGHRQRTRPERSGSAGRILVVEDNSLNQLVAEGVVSRLGYEVHSVSNGEEAVEAVARTTYSAVLMDCHMPVMDGFTATREIRRRQNGHRTAIIAMTAGAMSEDRERCLAAGMDDYISKPIDLHALEMALARWVPHAHRSPTPHGRASAEEPGTAEPALDESRLADLGDLQAPDGSSLLPAIVDSFVARSSGWVSEIRRSVGAEDADLLQRVAHEAKGASANVGARRVATLCGALELTAHQRSFRSAVELVAQLEAELPQAHAALRARLGPSAAN